MYEKYTSVDDDMLSLRDEVAQGKRHIDFSRFFSSADLLLFFPIPGFRVVPAVLPVCVCFPLFSVW